MLGLLQIDQECTGRSHRKRECIHCKSLQRIHLKLSSELLHCIVIYKCPFIKGGDVVMVTISLLCASLVTPWDEELFRSE